MLTDMQYEPLVGDSSILQTKGARYIELATQIGQSLQALDQITNEAETSSKAMDQFRELATNVRNDIAKTQGLYNGTGSALQVYAGQLQAAKSVADPAAALIAQYVDSAFTAQINVNTAYSELATAKYRRDHAAADITPEDRARLQTKVTNAQTKYNQCQSSLQSIQADLEYQKQRWTNNNGYGGGKELKDISAAQAANSINDVFDVESVKGLEDSKWEKIKAWWDQVYKVVSIICDVASFLSMFLAWVPGLGQVLLALAALGKILAIIDSLVKITDAAINLATGEGGLGDLAGAVALGLISTFGDKIFGAAGKLAGKGQKATVGAFKGEMIASFKKDLVYPFKDFGVNFATAKASKAGANFLAASFPGKLALLAGPKSKATFLKELGIKFEKGSKSAFGNAALRFVVGDTAGKTVTTAAAKNACGHPALIVTAVIGGTFTHWAGPEFIAGQGLGGVAGDISDAVTDVRSGKWVSAASDLAGVLTSPFSGNLGDLNKPFSIAKDITEVDELF